MPPRGGGPNEDTATSRVQPRLDPSSSLEQDRFDQRAGTIAALDEPCIVTIHGQVLDVTHWAKAHPGGLRILQKFHGRDATRAFTTVGHSDEARALLQTFVVADTPTVAREYASAKDCHPTQRNLSTRLRRWETKLFTQEDRYGIHKALGLFCLGNYVHRFVLMLFGDPTAGMGTTSDSLWPVLCLVPHALLSLSSLLFHTVPRERVVGKPMIWQEFRAHNIIFGVRSLVCSAVAWGSLHYPWLVSRHLAVCISGMAILLACAGADVATARLRARSEESTTATMPYWKDCSLQKEKIFKHVYAVAQFGATIGCGMVSNPIWPLAILLPIQGASFLMTLVRKGLISARSYHMAYLGSLLLVFLVGIRHLVWMWSWDLIGLFVVALVTYQLRRMGIDKFALWVPLVALRIAVGDDFLNWEIW
mmetsp:Transcript_6346/g.12315  ORF Transcript_6346/g.12315 Transcript_6346/m.12315 type:complete len:420 (-) Transcript_6346:1820-3079(-)